ncbi:prenylcysteine oxidase [Xylaria nigripes]|nr:prenylcysteine oxidase [Xylaria nigripes]
MASRNLIARYLFILVTWLQFCLALDLVEGPDSVKQIAIIGAGAAGSSAAYHLRKFADESGVAVNVTIFEKTGRIGGRILTVNVYDDPSEPIELGASIFVDVNYILSNATRDFNLTLKEPGTVEDKTLGVWNGDSFVYTQDSNTWSWVNLIRLVWKYGTAPYYTRKLVQDTVNTFLRLYKEPFFPFRSLSDSASELGLVSITGLTGQQFLAAKGLSGLFSHDIVQASTRVNYASNLNFIHGLGAMVSMAPEGAKGIKGGNWQIFANMVNASNAQILLNSPVTEIGFNADKKYKVSMAEDTDRKTFPEAQSHPAAFDDIVIATPFQFANISMREIPMQQSIDPIPYATLHVTLFASPHKFSPAFFNLPPGSAAPTSVLTTLGSDESKDSMPKQSGAGKVGFYSATLQRIAKNPHTLKSEYVYKIFSPHAVTPGFLSKLLGAEVPESFTRASGVENYDQGDGSADPISWIHAAIFHPYPQLLPRVTFQDPVLRDGLYYTSGIESFISTMETSALMGMNVARLIIDDYAGIPRMKAEVPEAVPVAPKYEEEEPLVLVQQQANLAESLGQSADMINELR